MSWWATLYDDWLADQLLDRDEAAEAETIAFLTAKLGLQRGMRVFDQCCGVGSLSLPLAAAGMHVIGVDQAANYIDRAQAEARRRDVSAEFVAGDALAFVPSQHVHAAFNWWTSFGYAETDAENVRMLARARESLMPGGRFLLDTMNVPGILRHFQPDVTLRRTTPRGDVLLLRESAIDLPRGVMNKRWTYFVDGRREVEHTSAVRLYMPDQLLRMLLGVGFADVTFLGSIGGEPLALDSPRLIALATVAT